MAITYIRVQIAMGKLPPKQVEVRRGSPLQTEALLGLVEIVWQSM